MYKGQLIGKEEAEKWEKDYPKSAGSFMFFFEHNGKSLWQVTFYYDDSNRQSFTTMYCKVHKISPDQGSMLGTHSNPELPSLGKARFMRTFETAGKNITMLHGTCITHRCICRDVECIRKKSESASFLTQLSKAKVNTFHKKA